MRDRVGAPFLLSKLTVTACTACLPFLVFASYHRQPSFQDPERRVSVGVWQTFSPPNAPFAITLPVLPIERSRDRKLSIKVRTYALKALLSEYLVVWAKGLPDGSSGRDLLDSSFPLAFKEMLGLAAASGGRFEEQYEKELNLDGNLGREAKMGTWPPNSHAIWARGYIVGSDFVGLIVSYPEEEEASTEAERFFDSLTLLRKGKESAPVDHSQQSSYQGAGGEANVDSDPLPLGLPSPSYTESARANKVQGPVRLRVLVNENGDVSEVRLVSHLPDGLDQEAIKSVRALKFKPATKGGEPVPGWASLVVDFWLRR